MAEKNTRTGGSHAAGHVTEETKKRPASEARQAREAAKAGKAAEKAARQAEKEAEKQARAEEKAERREFRRYKRKKAMKRLKIILIVAAVVLVLAAGGLGYWGYTVTNNGVICPKVTADGVDLSGMTEEQALAALQASGWDETAASMFTVKLPMDLKIELPLAESGAMMTSQEAAAAAAAYGHDSNWYANLFVWLQQHMKPYDVTDAEVNLNDGLIASAVEKACASYKEATNVTGYEIDEEKSVMTMMKGGGEIALDSDALTAAIKEAMAAGQTEITFDTLAEEPKMPDFADMGGKLEVEPVDAYYDTETKTIVPSTDGFHFEEATAESVWTAAAPGDIIEIPVEILKPQVSSEDLEQIYFHDTLGTKTTSYAGSTDSRINNIELAVSKINGLILNPGETFSYNETIGQRTEENGFQKANAYADGKVVEEIGGGICQVSSTLYCATRYARLTTVDRTNHYFAVSYIEKGQDATVSWPKPDFKFRNDWNYPIKIEAYLDPDNLELTVNIIGTDEDGCHVELCRDTFLIYHDVYTDVVIGYAVQPYYKVIDADGNVIDTVYNKYYDYYYLHDEDIQWPAGVSGSAQGELTVEGETG